MRYPPDSLKLNNHSDTILWMLNNNQYCLWHHFIKPPLKIPSASLSAHINRLKEREFIIKEIAPEETKPVYRITLTGQTELMRRLGTDLDFYEMIEMEKNKIRQQVSKLESFFKKYNILDDLIKIEFLSLYNTLFLNKTFSIFSEEQFNKLLLYLVKNDITIIKNLDGVLSIDDFIEKYNIDPEIIITKTDIRMVIQEIVDRNRYQIKYYKIPLEKDKFLFFRGNSDIGIFFETIVKKHLRNLNYLKSLNDSQIFESDLEDIMNPIMFDLIKKYKIFKEDIEKQVFNLAEEFITDLQIDLQGKPFSEVEKIPEYHSLFSPWVGFTHPFKSLNEEDEKELDIRSTFQRIREKEPKNKRYWGAIDFLLEENYEAALIEVDHYLELDPNDYYGIKLKSEILFESGNYEKALNIYRDALKQRKKYDDTYEEILDKIFETKILLSLKRYVDALDIINNQIPLIISKDQDVEETEFYKEHYYKFPLFKMQATIYYQQEKYIDSIEAINKNLEYLEKFKDEDYEKVIPESLLLKSKILDRIGYSTDEALESINEAIRLDSDNPEYFYQQAQLISSSNCFLSFFSINKAIKLDPDNKTFLYYKNVIKIKATGSLRGKQTNLSMYNEFYNTLKDKESGITKTLIIRKLKEKEEFIEMIRKKAFKNTEEFVEFVDDHINFLMKSNYINERDNGDLEISDSWDKIYNYVRIDEENKKTEILIIELFEIFINNGWKSVSREIMISKSILNDFWNKDFVKNTINKLIKSGILVESNSDLHFSIDKIESFLHKSTKLDTFNMLKYHYNS